MYRGVHCAVVWQAAPTHFTRSLVCVCEWRWRWWFQCALLRTDALLLHFTFTHCPHKIHNAPIALATAALAKLQWPMPFTELHNNHYFSQTVWHHHTHTHERINRDTNMIVMLSMGEHCAESTLQCIFFPVAIVNGRWNRVTLGW